MKTSRHFAALFTALTFLALHASAQLQPTEPDKSPLDVSYAPYGYPILKFQSKNAPAEPYARVIYSRPQKAGRTLFGGEVKFNEIWRLGANESTEIEFFRAATIGGKRIPKGRYTLFCIPSADNWTLILNRDLYTWGAFSYKPERDLARVTVPVNKVNGDPVEYFTMYFDQNNNLVILWDDLRVVVPVKFAGIP